MSDSFPRVASFKEPAALRAHLEAIGANLPLDDEIVPAPGSPMAREGRISSSTASATAGASSRWKDGTARPDGRPSEFTLRRWRRFGESGAKLIWGGEAVAVRPRRARQPQPADASTEETVGDLAAPARDAAGCARASATAARDDLLVGLQLTHSGRFCRPNRKDRLEPRIVYHHPILDRKFGIDPDDDPVL